jgi:hypothetical protein
MHVIVLIITAKLTFQHKQKILPAANNLQKLDMDIRVSMIKHLQQRYSEEVHQPTFTSNEDIQQEQIINQK